SGRDLGLGKSVDRARENNDRVRRPEIAPGMPTRAAHDDFKSPAAERFGHDGVGTRAVEHKAVLNLVPPFGVGKNMPHAPQIPRALLAHVADKHDGKLMGQLHGTQRTCDREHGSHPRAVIGDPGTVEPGTLLADVERSAGRENRVYVSADGNETAAQATPGAEDISHIVNAHFFKFQFLESFAQPVRAGGFAEWRRGNAGHFELPVRELRFLRAQPREGGPHRGQRRQAKHVLLHQMSDFRHCGTVTDRHKVNAPYYNAMLGLGLASEASPVTRVGEAVGYALVPAGISPGSCLWGEMERTRGVHGSMARPPLRRGFALRTAGADVPVQAKRYTCFSYS